jgi:drug/metabolite transporter (DMT)-like permease
MTRAAVLHGGVVEFGTVLHEDDVMIARFSSEEHVDFSWLQMVSTQHARLLIIDVLKKTGKNEKVSLGANLLQREMDYFGCGLFTDLSSLQQQQVVTFFRRTDFTDVLALIGEGVLHAKDVVLFLFPQDRPALFSSHTSQRHVFRLRVRMTDHSDFDTVFALQTLIHDASLVIDQMRIVHHPKHQYTDAFLVGYASDRLKFADFITLLDRQLWVSSVQTLLSRMQRLFLFASSFFALSIVLLDILFFPFYQHWISSYHSIPLFVTAVLPLLPIFAVNYYLLRLLRYYIVRMRSEQWFLGMGLLLNALGLVLIVVRIATSKISHISFLPLIGIFTISLLYIGARFFQADRLFSPLQSDTIRRPLSPLYTRIFGYSLRLIAICLWGALPIYIRYTPVATLSPLLRIFLTGIGVLVPFVLLHVVQSLWHRKKIDFHLSYSAAFWLFVFGQIGYAYLQHVTLLYTSSTNLQLFNGFAPVIGLFVAVLFWRREIPYLRKPQTMIWIFILTVMASFGSALLIYSNIRSLQHMPALAVTGDLLAMLSTFFDVLLTVGQIQYIKNHLQTNSILLNIHVFFYFCLFTAPLLLFLWLRDGPIFIPSTPEPLFFGLGVGLFVGVGLLLNYEALKRVDGYIAYMLFNLSIVVTFILEAFFVQSIVPTTHLLLSGILILGSSLIAEIINSRIDSSQ